MRSNIEKNATANVMQRALKAACRAFGRNMSVEEKGRIVRFTSQADLDEATISQVVAVAQRGFGNGMGREEVLEHLHGDLLQLIYVDQTADSASFGPFSHRGPVTANTSTLVGFASYLNLQFSVRTSPGTVEEDVNVLYLSGVVIDESCQGKGLSRLAMKEALEEMRPRALALRTQNPAMHSAMKKTVNSFGFDSEMFPSFSGDTNFQASEIAKRVSEMLQEKNYNGEKFTDRGTYGRALNKTVPKVNEYTEKLFESLGIDREKGDSIIMVAIFKDHIRDVLRTEDGITG